MSKLENIRKHVSEGKGNQKMLEYLLFYIKGLEDQLALEREIFKGERYKEGLRSMKADAMKFNLWRYDLGKITLEEYEEEARKNRL